MREKKKRNDPKQKNHAAIDPRQDRKKGGREGRKALPVQARDFSARGGKRGKEGLSLGAIAAREKRTRRKPQSSRYKIGPRQKREKERSRVSATTTILKKKNVTNATIHPC